MGERERERERERLLERGRGRERNRDSLSSSIKSIYLVMVDMYLLEVGVDHIAAS